MPGENLGTKIGSAFIEVGASFVGFGSSLASDVSNSLLAQTFVVGQALESFGQAVFTRFSLPLLAATTANIAQFQALDREIRTTLTLFGTAPTLVRDTFDEMAEGVRQVSTEVGGLERDIADGLYQAISAGVPRGGVFEFLEVAQMAAIADRTADITTAVDGLTTVINAFGLESEDAGRAADVMFQTVALGKTTFGELSQDIGRVAPLAANAGVAFEELFAIVGALTLQGLKTSEAISFLRASITGLLRPGDELTRVFEDAGFASAEAAVPIIGLQSAFQLVFDAVGGSTSQMQELIGTSEGVSAILGVTGDNADTFARIMGGVETSTGAAVRAFEIMDESVGRTFGRLTEAFDRLGNTFGEMASEFATPVLVTATNVINNLVDVFSSFRPIVRGLGEAFANFMQVFDLPVIRELVTGFAALAVTFVGMIGSIGLIALIAGKMITTLLTVKVVVRVLGLLQGAINLVQLGAALARIRLAAFSKVLTGSVVAGSTLAGKAVGGLATIMSVLSASPLRAAGAFAVLVGAVGALVAAFGNAIQKQRQYIEDQDILGKGVDGLIESLGLVEIGFTRAGAAAEGNEEFLKNFGETNEALIRSIVRVRNELGQTAATEQLESVLASIAGQSNATREDLERAAFGFEHFLGIDIPDSFLAGLESRAQIAFEIADGVGVLGDQMRLTNRVTTEFQGASNAAATALFDLFQIVRTSGDFQLLDDAVQSVAEGLSPEQAKAFGATLGKIFEEGIESEPLFGTEEIDLFPGFSLPQNILKPGELLDRLHANGFSVDGLSIVQPVKPEFDVPEGDVFGFGTDNLSNILSNIEGFDEKMAIATRAQEEYGFAAIESFGITQDQITKMDEFAAGIAGIFEGATTEVENAMGAIRDSVASQQPLLDVYSGAIKQSFAEWRAGQNQFQEDVKAVTTLRERLVESDLPSALIDAFDRQPLSKQVWLAGLGEKNLEIALGELEESFVAAQEAGQERVVQSFEGIFSSAKEGIAEQYLELATEAATNGTEVTSAFQHTFQLGLEDWLTTANNYITDLKADLGVFIPGPVIGPPTFSGGPPSFSGLRQFDVGGGDTNVFINNPNTQDPVSDAETAAAILAVRNAGGQ